MAKRKRRNAERSEQTKHYRTQSAAEKAATRAHKKYYSVTLWRVHDRDWAVHMKELKPKDLRNPRRPPGYGSFKRIARKAASKAASYVAGKRSRGRGTHKAYRAGRDAARNPRQLLFKSRAAAVKYAKAHGAKRFSVKKLERGR
jgi:hypothetical protein